MGISKESSCPTCGEAHESNRAMKIHHKMAHGESVAKVVKECPLCQDEFETWEDESNSRVYCSQSCQNSAHSERISGESHPRYTLENRECDNCSESIKVADWELKRYDNHYCSEQCRLVDFKEVARSNTDERSPRYAGGPEIYECEVCGEKIESYRKRRFCGNECYGIWWSNNKTGKDHPHWKGGCNNIPYGENWDIQRMKAKDRDGFRCVDCGMADSESIEKYGFGLSVHHKLKRRFAYYHPFLTIEQDANTVENLVTLCKSCHSTKEEQ